MEQPLRLVLVGIFVSGGDQLYRLHQPAAALAREQGVEVHELHPTPAPATTTPCWRPICRCSP